MNRSHLFILPMALAACTVFFNGCTKDKTPVPVEPCDPNKVYFQNDVFPIIASNCAKSGCHDAATQAEEINLSSYNGIMKIVKPGNPSGSDLMKVINTPTGEKAMPPAPNTPLSQTKKDMISKWISEGALNNYCSNDLANCTTDSVTYSGTISKIMISNNCLSCHSGATIKGGFDLSNYSGVQSAAASGKLYNAVLQNGSAVAMPPSPAPKISSCDSKKIKAWIDAGMKNN
ncbi:MAG: hypothetical protein PSX36_04985 [bacterium]|nr:hypothetical protein [bacterium]